MVKKKEVKTDITQKKENLDKMIIAVNNEAEKIKKLDQAIVKMKDAPSRKKYQEQLAQLCDDYFIQVDCLEKVVDEYIKQVKKETGTTPLVYYRLFKALSGD